MVVELLASGNNRPPDPGKFDEVAIARYLSGGCSSEEARNRAGYGKIARTV